MKTSGHRFEPAERAYIAYKAAGTMIARGTYLINAANGY